MACYALTMVCSAAAASGACNADDATWSNAVDALAACAHTDLNRFAMGFAAECLRRLAQDGGLACAEEALERFVASPRWKPPELAVGHIIMSTTVLAGMPVLCCGFLNLTLSHSKDIDVLFIP